MLLVSSVFQSFGFVEKEVIEIFSLSCADVICDMRTRAVRTEFLLSAGSEEIIAIQSCQAEDTAFSLMMYMSLLINSERPATLETRVNRVMYWIRSLPWINLFPSKCKKWARPKPFRAENVTVIANTLPCREMPNKTPIRMSYLLTTEFSRKFIWYV